MRANLLALSVVLFIAASGCSRGDDTGDASLRTQVAALDTSGRKHRPADQRPVAYYCGNFYANLGRRQPVANYCSGDSNANFNYSGPSSLTESEEY